MTKFNKRFQLKIKTFLLLFFASFILSHSEELVLKPLNPLPLRDDAFNIKINIDVSRPVKVESWVKFLSADWSKMPMKDWYVFDSAHESHDTELRVFLIKDGASYDEIREAVRKLLAMGYRQTTLFHLVAFSNTENARNLNLGVMTIVSERPVLRLDDKNTISLKVFYGAVMKNNEIAIGIVKPEDVNHLPTRILILEPPLNNS